jgi:hypothetical protein
MKLSIVALLLVACVAYTRAGPVPEPGLLDLGSLTGLLGGLLGSVLGLVGGLVSGVLAGVLGTLGAGGLLGIDLSKLKGLDLVTGLLGTVTTLVKGLPIVGPLVGNLLEVVTVTVNGVLTKIIGGLPVNLDNVPTDPNVVLTLVCPLLGVLGAVVAILANIAGLAVGVVGAVVTLAVSVTGDLPLLGDALKDLPGLIGANVIQLLNINVLVNALCAKPPAITPC